MKSNKGSRPTIRKVDIWPDIFEQPDCRFQRDNDRFAAVGILIAIILILVLVISFKLGQISELQKMTSEVEAAEFDDSTADQIDMINRITPTTTPDPGLPLPDQALADGSFKTYMDYRAITRKDSPQYQLQKLAWTDADGFRRYEQYYLIAMGTAYTNTIGETFDITLSTGKTIACMVGDVKDNQHTDRTNRYIPINGNIVEFIIDSNRMDPGILSCGDISSLGFQGAVTQIQATEYSEATP